MYATLDLAPRGVRAQHQLVSSLFRTKPAAACGSRGGVGAAVQAKWPDAIPIGQSGGGPAEGGQSKPYFRRHAATAKDAPARLSGALRGPRARP